MYSLRTCESVSAESECALPRHSYKVAGAVGPGALRVHGDMNSVLTPATGHLIPNSTATDARVGGLEDGMRRMPVNAIGQQVPASARAMEPGERRESLRAVALSSSE